MRSRGLMFTSMRMRVPFPWEPAKPALAVVVSQPAWVFLRLILSKPLEAITFSLHLEGWMEKLGFLVEVFSRSHPGHNPHVHRQTDELRKVKVKELQGAPSFPP